MKKSPILAFILSIIPGLGHIYAMGIKGVPRALVFLGGIGISLWFCLLLIGFLMVPVVWLWCAVDAMGMAVLANEAKIKDGVFGV
jgi:hypothetical protein